MKKLVAFLLLPGIFFLVSSFYPAAKVNVAAHAKTPEQTITLGGLYTKMYIPPKAPGSGGDNDFFGHGPSVRINVEIFIKAKATLYARITFTATEVGGDGSSASGSREEMIYFAGFSNEILAITSPVTSSFSFTDDSHEEDYVGAGGRVKANEAHSYWNEHPSFVNDGSLVRFCVVNGDNDGSEIGSRTGVRVFFNPITIRVKNPVAGPLNNVTLNVAGSDGCGENTCSASVGAGLLQHYGFSVSCAQFWARECSTPHLVNWARDNHIANMGMPPNVLRDKLKEWEPDVQLKMLTTSNYINEIKRIIRTEHRPVIALTAWGSKGVKDYYAPKNDSYGIGNAILHYVLIDGFDDGGGTINEKVWHVIDNGVHKKWTQEFFASVFFWKPENFVIEGILYPQDVHPGNIVY